MNKKTKDIILLACEQLNAKYEDNAIWFENLLYDAIRTMNSARILHWKRTTFNVYDNKGTLPTDLLKPDFIITNDDGDEYCPNIDYQVQGSTIIFTEDLIDDDTDLTIRYKGLLMDKNGNVDIPEKWTRALVAYISWKYAQRHFDKFPRDVRAEYQREYVLQKSANR